MSKVAMVMAGGTGGHIFPGLAVAEALRARNWRVHWLGAPDSMESRLVGTRGFAFEPINFSGLRGKGLLAFALLPLRLLKAFGQSIAALRRVRPHVVLGLGGYISFPGGLMGVLLGKPLVLHEQNAVAGLANRVLASVAERQFSTFPSVFPRGTCIGNPLRSAFVQQAPPEQRFATRSGPLRILVVGGSLGAQALNENLPRALALIPPDQRPQVRHQSGERQLDALLALYQSLGVLADLTPFIDNPAEALAEADLIICRAGASTVSEVAAVGAAAIFVPYPHAVDDHQTRNARHLVDAGAGWLLPQSQLTPETLAARIQGMERASLLQTALAAHQLAKLGATEAIVAACEELAL